MGTPVHPLALPRLRGSRSAPWRLARDAGRLARVIRRERIALVQANTMRASVYAALGARLGGAPLLWHVHDILSERAYVRWMCRASDLALAVSDAAANALPCRDKVTVIHNGVELEPFRAVDPGRAAEIRRGWNVPPHAFLVGQVARLQPWKGQRDFIAIAGLLLDAFPDTYFALVGGDIFADASRYERELRDLAEQRGFGPRMVFAGHRDDIPAVLHALDALVHVSEAEPFGRILVEALAAGCPIVADASGAVTELLEDDCTALLVPPRDHAAFARAIGRLIDDPTLARRLARSGRTRAEDFAAPEYARRFERACRRVLLARWTRQARST
jgi:glycosyltransferase involved in cell wall biosynthesis